ATQWQLPAEFSRWIQQSCFWCNTLVDRIVPGYPKERADELTSQLGYSDALLTEGEQFHLLVIEGSPIVEKEFPAPMAGLQVVFTQDITPYRTRKVRILNGAHTAMVPVAYLAGLRTVRETVEDPQFGAFVTQLIEKEIIPTLDTPREELESYAREVIQRFRNPFIRHELRSIALYCTAKFVTRLLPSLLRYQQQTGQLPRHLVFALAALIRFYQGTTASGEAIPLQDEADRIAFFQEAWQQHADDLDILADTILRHEAIWEQDLRKVPGLAALVVDYLKGMPLRGEPLQLPQ
ncbi:MAG: tagaturonate reductase, partial [Lewinellaceae bacterium]|nr:tagaturonate reductase [Lewinellaceae bacterium]